MKITDLKPNFLDLPQEDQYELVRDARNKRLQSTTKTRVVGKKREKKDAKLSQLDKMSVDELDILIARLEASRGNKANTESTGEEEQG